MPPALRVRTPTHRVEPPQIVVVDTETTGLGHHNRPPRPDGIVQIGYSWRNNRGKVVRWEAVCNPGSVFLLDGRASLALGLSGIRVESISAAPAAREVAAELRERLKEIETESGRRVEVRSYNRAFDEPFLGTTPWKLPATIWGPCIMEAAQVHLRLERWPRLDVALKMLGIQPPPGRAHTAGVDSHAALLVMERTFGRSSRVQAPA